MLRLALVIGVVAAIALPAIALANGKVFFEDAIPGGKSSSVTITTQRVASFRVLLRVPTQGRGKLFLTGKHAPKGGPLIDTKTFACEGAAGSFYCRASYEPLPKGNYTWRISWVSTQQVGPKMPAHVELTVRW
jgi:hypothetical protein